MSAKLKDVGSKKQFGFDWGPYLDTKIIVTSSWSIPKDESMIGAEIFTDTVTKLIIEGGIDGQDYNVTNRVVLDSGEIEEKSFSLMVRDKI